MSPSYHHWNVHCTLVLPLLHHRWSEQMDGTSDNRIGTLTDIVDELVSTSLKIKTNSYYMSEASMHIHSRLAWIAIHSGHMLHETAFITFA